jgi:hypothetical protein
MQNWEHLLTIMDSINAVPTNVEADISRVRQWLLDGHGKLYRQTLAFSGVNFTELHVLFSKYDRNFAGHLNLTSLPTSRLEEVTITCLHPGFQANFRLKFQLRKNFIVLLVTIQRNSLISASSTLFAVFYRN